MKQEYQSDFSSKIDSLLGKQKFIEKRSVLVIEDDQIIAKLLRHTLTQRGFFVNVANDGRQAIETIESETPPSFVLLDIVLPYFDGFEVLKKIRAKNDWSKVPTIMLTSKTQELNIVRAFDAGADDYITKPFQVEELMARIRRLVK